MIRNHLKGWFFNVKKKGTTNETCAFAISVGIAAVSLVIAIATLFV